MKAFSELGVEVKVDTYIGQSIKVDRVLNKKIVVHKYVIEDSKFGDGNKKRLKLQVEIDGEKRIIWSGSNYMMNQIKQVDDNGLPFTTVITKTDQQYQFT